MDEGSVERGLTPARYVFGYERTLESEKETHLCRAEKNIYETWYPMKRTVRRAKKSRLRKRA